MKFAKVFICIVFTCFISVVAVAQDYALGLHMDNFGLNKGKYDYLIPADKPDRNHPLAIFSSLNLEGYKFSENGNYQFISIGSDFRIGNSNPNVYESESVNNGDTLRYVRTTEYRDINIRVRYGYGRYVDLDRFNIMAGLVAGYDLQLKNSRTTDASTFQNGVLREESYSREQNPVNHQLNFGGEVRGLYELTERFNLGIGIQIGIHGNYINGVEKEYRESTSYVLNITQETETKTNITRLGVGTNMDFNISLRYNFFQ